MSRSQSGTVPAARRLEARVNAAYDLMERYPLQLHDLDRAEFLDAKRRERENQLHLQQKSTGAPPTANRP